MIRMGQIILAVGVAALLIPGPQALALAGLVLVGWAARPSTPASSTPRRTTSGRQVTGRHRHPDGQRLCGQPDHAAAVRPAGQQHHPALFPFYLLALLVLMVCMHEQLVRKTRRS